MYRKLLSKNFFNNNPFKEISAQRLFYSKLSYKGMEEFASQYASKLIDKLRLDEIEKEKQMILAESRPKILINMLRKGMDTINVPILEKRLLDFEDEVLPDIFNRLLTNLQDGFIESALTIFNNSKRNYSEEFLLQYDNIRNEYTKSLVCILLGFRGDESIIPWMYDTYFHFKKKYPNENYKEGSLLALYELNSRFYY